MQNILDLTGLHHTVESILDDGRVDIRRCDAEPQRRRHSCCSCRGQGALSSRVTTDFLVKDIGLDVEGNLCEKAGDKREEG